MFRSLQAFVLSLFAAWVLLPGMLRADEARELSILAAAHDGPLEAGIGPVQLPNQGGVVIRNAHQLVALSARPDSAEDAALQKEMEAELAKILEVSAIDWSKQMVLAVRGQQGTRLDRIHFHSLKIEGKILTVAWKVKQRPPHAGPGTPVSLILVDRHDGEVRFVEGGQK